MVGGSLEMGDEEGRDGKLLVLPGEPQLVASVPRQGLRLERKVVFFMSFLKKEWRVARVDLFLSLMYPVELTSKQFTVHL